MELTNSAQMSCAHFLAHERQQRVRHTQGINPVLLTDDFEMPSFCSQTCVEGDNFCNSRSCSWQHGPGSCACDRNYKAKR